MAAYLLLNSISFTNDERFTVESLLWGHPFCNRNVALQEGWPRVRGYGKNQYIGVYIYIVK